MTLHKSITVSKNRLTVASFIRFLCMSEKTGFSYSLKPDHRKNVTRQTTGKSTILMISWIILSLSSVDSQWTSVTIWMLDYLSRTQREFSNIPSEPQITVLLMSVERLSLTVVKFLGFPPCSLTGKHITLFTSKTACLAFQLTKATLKQ